MAITRDEVDAMTARKTEALHPSLRVCTSSARLSGGLGSQLDSVNQPALSSTQGKPTSMYGLLTTT
jgi:hypothetical protein